MSRYSWILFYSLKYVPSAGVQALGTSGQRGTTDPGFWWGDLTPDQRPVDAYSLVYDSAPLCEDTATLGMPQVFLQASSTAPLAHWFVRLSDVAPDGAVSLVTGAGLNGAHRESADVPRPLEPGKVYPLKVEMHFTSWIFPRGHRIRLAISNALWPMVWPTPHAMTTSLYLGGQPASRFLLPVVPAPDHPGPKFLPPQPSDQLPGIDAGGSAWPGRWTIGRDETGQATTVKWGGNYSGQYPWGRVANEERLTYAVQDTHSELASVRGEAETTVHLRDRVLTWRGLLDLKSDATNFLYRFKRELWRDGLLIREKTWDFPPRPPVGTGIPACPSFRGIAHTKKVQEDVSCFVISTIGAW